MTTPPQEPIGAALSRADAGLLGPWDLPPLVPMLLDRWQHGPPAVHEAARTVLGGCPPTSWRSCWARV
ncbi:hypothetical protein [Streptomyces microflavus]|uniref:hypothetical protein n=1 Tax=Streptomyces microflavus TaxID=1919 RepID=UPI0036ED8500